jgi:regulatory protein
VVIVGVAQQPRRQDRYSVSVEDEAGTRVRLVVSDEFALRRRLREGDQLDPKAGAELIDAATRCTAYDRATNALASRGRSTKELERWLTQRGIAASHIAPTIAQLTKLGLLDDARYAHEFVRVRVAGRGKSVWSLRRDLARRGVERSLADEAINAAMVEGGVDELAIARREAAKKWKALSRLDRVVARRRLMAFLLRRGFPGDVVQMVSRELLREPDGIA